MSMILNRNSFVSMPEMELTGSIVGVTLNATGETCHFIGHVELENPLSGAKTLSSAGGGSIVWRSGAITFANAGSTFEVGIQDVSTSASPGQGDGNFDVEASYTGGGGGITGSAVQTSVMTSGSKSIAHNQLIAITLAITAVGGADSVVISSLGKSARTGVSNSLPVVTDNTTGSYAAIANSYPLAYIIFDDGTLGWLHDCPFHYALGSFNVNSGSATADEYGNLINLPVAFKASGVSAVLSLANASTDFELNLYSDALGSSPVLELSSVIDATQVGRLAATRTFSVNFSNSLLMRPHTNYAITIRPTTANNVQVSWFDTDTLGKKTGAASDYCYAVRRLDNTGPFEDYNGGTAKTRLMWINLLGNYIEQGVNNSTSQIGI